MANGNGARARSAWQYRGERRPPFAEEPSEGQESVWDYPRPPAFVPDQRRVEIYAGDRLLARTEHSIRVLETGSPPAFYLPPEAFEQRLLRPSPRRTFCEWKGEAEYFGVYGPGIAVPNALWRYPRASGDAAVIAGWFACYPGKLRCFVDDEAARAQPGGFYGGWITDELVGPWKGSPGTGHW